MNRRKFLNMLMGIPLAGLALKTMNVSTPACSGMYSQEMKELLKKKLYMGADLGAKDSLGSVGLFSPAGGGVLLAETSFMLDGTVVHKSYNRVTDDGINFEYTIKGDF